MIKKHKNVCRVLNCTDYLLIVTSAITGCFSISVFTSLVGILIGITSSAIQFKIGAMTVKTKKHKLIIKEEKKKL